MITLRNDSISTIVNNSAQIHNKRYKTVMTAVAVMAWTVNLDFENLGFFSQPEFVCIENGCGGTSGLVEDA